MAKHTTQVVLGVLLFASLQAPVWWIIHNIYANEPAQWAISEVQIQEIPDARRESIMASNWQAHTLPKAFCVWDCTTRYKAHQLDFLHQPGETPALYILRIDTLLHAFT